MFRLIRLILFVALAFGAGMLFERSEMRARCGDLGGVWTPDRLCSGG